MKRLCAYTLLTTLLAACADDDMSMQSGVPSERGMALVTANGCTACHALNSTRGVGPGWAGLYGATRQLKDGRSVIADDTYLRRAMLEPAADVVAGFDNVMVPANVSDAQIADIIALIRELQDMSSR